MNKPHTQTTPAQGLRQTLLEDPAYKNFYLHVVYDPMLDVLDDTHALYDMLGGALMRVAHKVVFNHPSLEESDAPLIIALNHLPNLPTVLDALEAYALAELSPSSLQRGNGRSICGFIATPQALATDPLAWAANAVQPYANQDYWIRWHDPAVLWGLFTFIAEDDQHNILNGMAHYWLYNPRGQLLHYRGQHAASPPAVHLNATQWGYIRVLSYANMALSQHLADLLPDDAALKKMYMNMLEALTHHHNDIKLSSAQDAILYAAHAARYGATFYKHPAVAEYLAPTHPRTYVDRVAMLPEGWQRQLSTPQGAAQ